MVSSSPSDLRSLSSDLDRIQGKLPDQVERTDEPSEGPGGRGGAEGAESGGSERLHRQNSGWRLDGGGEGEERRSRRQGRLRAGVRVSVHVCAW